MIEAGNQESSEDRFMGILNAETDKLSLVIKCHYSIDCLLNETLQEALANAEALEVQRISFLLKVDFLIALGIVRDDIRGVYVQINSIRNKFAHNPYYEYSAQDANTSKSVLISTKRPSVPESFHEISHPLEILKNLLAAGFITAAVGFESWCHRKCEAVVINQLMRETLHRKSLKPSGSPMVTEEFSIRVRKLLQDKYPHIKRDV